MLPHWMQKKNQKIGSTHSFTPYFNQFPVMTKSYSLVILMQELVVITSFSRESWDDMGLENAMIMDYAC